MRAVREVGVTAVAVAAMMISSTSVRAQRAVGTDCTSSANAAVQLGPDGDCGLRGASEGLFAWVLDGGDRHGQVTRSGAPGLDALAYADRSSPFTLVLAGESAADRRRAKAGDDGLSLVLWVAILPGSGVGGTSFWLDVLDAALSVDWPPTSHGRAVGLAASTGVFLGAVKGSNGPGEWPGVQWFDDLIRDNRDPVNPYFYESHDPPGPDGTLAVTANPEPGSLALIATGLAGLGGLGVRRRKASRR